MAPTAVAEIAPNVDLADLKAKTVNSHLELEVEPKPPVADNYMYDFKYNHALPTIDSLGRDVPTDTNASQVAAELIDQLEGYLGDGNSEGFAGMFLDYGVWRDKLAFTWDYRTFNFRDAIARAANDLLPSTRCSNFRLLSPAPAVQRPYPDLAFLQFSVSFDTPLVNASAVINSVLTTGGWKLWTVHSSIESLLQFPEVEPRDGHMTGPISWEKQRAQDVDSIKPDVVIIGAGQNGLVLGARLKALGVSTLLIEQSKVVGSIWRNRYEYLSLHFPHWADHFPYFPYPEHWPT